MADPEVVFLQAAFPMVDPAAVSLRVAFPMAAGPAAVFRAVDPMAADPAAASLRAAVPRKQAPAGPLIPLLKQAAFPSLHP